MDAEAVNKWTTIKSDNSCRCEVSPTTRFSCQNHPNKFVLFLADKFKFQNGEKIVADYSGALSLTVIADPKMCILTPEP